MYHLSFKGANQLLWYYADLEKKKCLNKAVDEGIVATTALSAEILEYANSTSPPKPDFPPPEIDHCLTWRRFAK